MSVPDETDQSEFWQQRLEEYLGSLRAKGRKPGTIANNRTVLQRWILHALSHGGSPETNDQALVDRFLDNQNDLRDGSRRSYSDIIRWWCNYRRSQTQPARVWVVRAGEKGETEQYNLDHNVITIGWDWWLEGLEPFADGDEEPFADRDELGEFIYELRGENEDNRRVRDQIWRFGKDIQVNDLVVMPQKRPDLGSRLIAIGRVTGRYEYDPSHPKATRIRRAVEWLRTDVLRDILEDDLNEQLNRPPTTYPTRAFDSQYRIQYLAEHGVDPGDRNAGDDEDAAKFWEDRLKQYLRGVSTRWTHKRNVLRRWIVFTLEQGMSPVDDGSLFEFLDAQGDLADTTRNGYANHIRRWCRDWDSGAEQVPPLKERLESAAGKLLCDVKHLEEIVELLEDKRQVILYGPPGTGKTYLAQELAVALAPAVAAWSLVQFHPAYSYEDFFEGYRPVLDDDNQMIYQLQQGPLANLADRADAYPDETHVMVIDEINRANLPRVLGELLFLLEYRNKSIQVMHRPEDDFSLPKNLWFIGTMNTADRSIALIDAAMRRRFHFVPFFEREEPTKSLLRKWTQKYAPDQAWVVDLVSAVNGELEKELGGEHLQLGPSYFMKTDLNDGGFERVWRYNIEPFIEDQLFGNPDKIARFRLDAVLQRHRGVEKEPDAPADEPAIINEPPAAVSSHGSARGTAGNNDDLVSGQEIYDGFKAGTLPFTWMGRNLGRSGQTLRDDLSSGKWRTWSYEVRYESISGNRNWFPISDFVEMVDQRSRP